MGTNAVVGKILGPDEGFDSGELADVRYLRIPDRSSVNGDSWWAHRSQPWRRSSFPPKPDWESGIAGIGANCGTMVQYGRVHDSWTFTAGIWKRGSGGNAGTWLFQL